jgi:hypothetical protein
VLAKAVSISGKIPPGNINRVGRSEAVGVSIRVGIRYNYLFLRTPEEHDPP